MQSEVLMALTTTHQQTAISVSRVLFSVPKAIYQGLMLLSVARSRVQKLEYLQSLSDEDLKKKGLTREQIVYHVFADTGWV